ncbi:SH3 domain-containing protein [Sulfurimonas sp.]|uniref:SH3 domain-containing protein n=1 Tax=Sulfurimonas sp. TaxID=2022749 RepID=UPI0025E4B0EA|nr:SH3 domain-containing protein [Sulfurimonas sp.]
MSRKLTVLLLFVFSLQANDFRDEVLSQLIKDSENFKHAIIQLKLDIKQMKDKSTELELELEKFNKKTKVISISKNQLITSDKHIFSLHKEAIVTSWHLNLRKEPNKEAKIIRTYEMGDIVTIVDFNNKGWCKTTQGFIKSTYIEIISNEKLLHIKIKNNLANIRENPYFSKNTIDTFNKNKSLVVYAVLFNKEWYKLKNNIGYVHRNIVEIIE